jgi:cleavage and polyadenylation specificity factor subunit 1
VYLDDVLIASANLQQHEEHLRAVLGRLQQAGLVLNRSKCVFAAGEIEFLGHRVTAAGISPLQSRIEAVQNFPQPKDTKQLMSFLGLLNFYRRFLPQAAGVLRPLTDKLAGGQPAKLEWTDQMNSAFEKAKQLLCAATCLAHPDPAAELSLAVDASNTHVGAVLQQASARGPQPLGFFSKKLSAAQSNYSTFDRELLACYEAIRHFRWSLEGRSFILYTDHKPLTHALSRVSDPWTPRQQRHLAYVAEFTSDIRHVAGRDNQAADAMSRPPVAAVAPAPGEQIDYADMAAQQSTCQATQQLAASSTLLVVRLELNGTQLLCDVSTGTPRPLVPVAWQKRIFHALHGLAHPGKRATRRLVSSRFVWKGCAAAVNTWCNECTGCARGKPGGTCSTPVESIPIPEQRFSHVHVDLVGPLPASPRGHTHLLTVVDRTTRWPEVFPVRDISAATCIDTFTAGWIARFGVPAVITTDKGPQFMSDTWREFCEQVGVQHVHTTSFHPQSNGMVERLHRQLKEALRAREAGGRWLEHLPWVLLGLRAAPKESADVSAAEVVYGIPLTLPGQHGRPAERDSWPEIPSTVAPRRPDPQAGTGPAPSDSGYCFVQRGQKAALQPLFDGPYRIVEVRAKTVLVDVGAEQQWVSRDRIKPYQGTSPPTVAVRKRRGRPRGKRGGR